MTIKDKQAIEAFARLTKQNCGKKFLLIDNIWLTEKHVFKGDQKMPRIRQNILSLRTKSEGMNEFEITDRNIIDHFKKLRKKIADHYEFIELNNKIEYQNLHGKRKAYQDLQGRPYDSTDPEWKAYQKKINKLNKWIEHFVKWFFDNDIDFAGLSKRERSYCQKNSDTSVPFWDISSKR